MNAVCIKYYNFTLLLNNKKNLCDKPNDKYPQILAGLSFISFKMNKSRIVICYIPAASRCLYNDII